MRIPKKRPLSKTCIYYGFRIVGPLVLVCGVGFIAVIVWMLSLLQIVNTHPVITPCCFVISLIPLVMYMYSVLYTLIGDVGETKKALLNPKYSRLLTNEFLESLPKCPQCGLPKPERCHHCSICNKCHLRMDHHCPAVGVCISIKNTQSFIVMLNWALVLIITNLFELVLGCILLPKMRTPILIMMLLLFVLLIAVGAFLHDCLKRATHNVTTLEELADERNVYDMGKRENLNQILGRSKFRMWIPKKNVMSGFEWSLPQYRQDDNLM